MWRAAEWARPDGQVAFALSGGFLFQQSEGMPHARASLFRAFDVTSIINGAALRKTKVWPDITSPFCIFFARNRPAGPASAMRFITPRGEPRLNRAGVFRLDAANAPIVLASDVAADPLRLKTLFRGSELDVDLSHRVLAMGYPRLIDIVRSMGGRSGTGIQKLRPSSRIRRGQTKPGADAAYLHGMPYLRVGIPAPFVDTHSLDPFDADRIHDPRDIEIFRAPLLMVDKVVRARSRGFAVGLALEDTAFSVNYYGYGFAKGPNAVDTAHHVAAVLRSSFAQWWFLITSGEYGYEREVVEKHTFDKLPIPLPPVNSAPQQNGLGEWYRRHAGNLDQDELDERVADAYGLTPIDRRVIDDTLTYAFADPVDAAPHGPSLGIRNFIEGLAAELSPWGRDFGMDLRLAPVDGGLSPTWRFVTVGVPRRPVDARGRPHPFPAFVQAADESGSTEVYHQATDGRLWIGMPGEARFWTFSQGLRSAKHIIWNHIEFLLGEVDGGTGA